MSAGGSLLSRQELQEELHHFAQGVFAKEVGTVVERLFAEHLPRQPSSPVSPRVPQQFHPSRLRVSGRSGAEEFTRRPVFLEPRSSETGSAMCTQLSADGHGSDHKSDKATHEAGDAPPPPPRRSIVADYGITWLGRHRKTNVYSEDEGQAICRHGSAPEASGRGSTQSFRYSLRTQPGSYVQLSTPAEEATEEDLADQSARPISAPRVTLADVSVRSSSRETSETGSKDVRTTRIQTMTQTMDFYTRDTAFDRRNGLLNGQLEYLDYEADEEDESQETCVTKLVRSQSFDLVTTCVIVINALVLGIQTDFMARHWTHISPVWCRVLEGVCCAYFTLEMCLRLHVYRSEFWKKPRRWWNIADLILVAAQIADNVQQFLMSILKIWRVRYAARVLLIASILRILRILRIARVLNMFGELRMLLTAMAQSGRSVCWCIIMMLLMTFCMSVYITQVVTEHKLQKRGGMGDEERERLEQYFGSLGVAMLSFYEMISEGIHWHEVMDPVREYCSPYLAFVFAAYMGFTIFAVLNVITGIFVETAMQSIGEDRRKMLMQQMRKFFERADADGSGTLTLSEFMTQIESEEMKTMLKAMDLDKDEAVDLFQLLDVGDTGELGVHSFLHGVLRLSGSAKAIELSTFMNEWKRWAKVWQVHALFIEEHLTKASAFLSNGSPNRSSAATSDSPVL